MGRVGLKSIEKDIQNIAEAISAVLKVDVTIVNEKLERISGTGKYAERIGQHIEALTAFGLALKEKRQIFIENPREDEICKLCGQQSTCKEFAVVCCPIVLKDEVIGLIGLVAFDEAQAHNIRRSKDVLVDYLDRMGELISSKIQAESNSRELELEKRKLEALFNTMDKAVASTDDMGRIEKFNRRFIDLFAMDETVKGTDIRQLLCVPESGIGRKSGTFHYEGNNARGIYTASPILFNDMPIGYLFEFIDSKSAIKHFNDMTENSVHLSFEDILGKSAVLEQAKKKARQAAGSPSTLLITGESGTGKELFARAIHHFSDRKDYPFMAVNCGAIPDNLLESELFGYEEGAFTGAKKGGKLGKFEIANKGTLFLDEIGDLSLHLQVKLLRVLQERELERVGSNKRIKIDVRIICATNKNLEEMVSRGEFRRDLFFRLNVIPIGVPPLRDRKEDIPLLVDSMIRRCNKLIKKNIRGMDEEARACILNYSWPGNVRELQNAIEYAVNMTGSDYIRVWDLPEKLRSRTKAADANAGLPDGNNAGAGDDRNGIVCLKELEKREIERALKKYGRYKNDKALVCEVLGISLATLYRKMKEYGLPLKMN